MPKRLNLAGRRFGRLFVKESSPSLHPRVYWLCICICGNSKIVLGRRLQSGHTRSCGCLQREAPYKHGHKSSGAGGTPTYHSWLGMIQRCRNPKHPSYRLYGGRGIKVCVRWQGERGFANFLADMGEKPKRKSLDRFPNKNGNYKKSNCRWATPRQQMLNRRLYRFARPQSSSGFFGVHHHQDGFTANITFVKQKRYLGFFTMAEDGPALWTQQRSSTTATKQD